MKTESLLKIYFC